MKDQGRTMKDHGRTPSSSVLSPSSVVLAQRIPLQRPQPPPQGREVRRHPVAVRDEARQRREGALRGGEHGVFAQRLIGAHQRRGAGVEPVAPHVLEQPRVVVGTEIVTTLSSCGGMLNCSLAARSAAFSNRAVLGLRVLLQIRRANIAGAPA